MMTHASLALENYRHADTAATNAWRVTMYFYAGVHAVNHAIFGNSFAPPSYDHVQRREWVRIKWDLLDRVTYKDLEEVSRVARYHANEHPLGDEMAREAKNLCQDVLKRAGLPV